MPKRAEILLVDDEEALCNAASKILTKENYRVSFVHTAQEGLAKFETETVDLLITDLMLPDSDGISVLKRAKEIRPTIEVIVITGHGTVEKAVEAMRLGAYDFIEKPLDKAQLLKAVSKAVERQRLSRENQQLRDELKAVRGEESFIGGTPAMIEVKKLVRQVAPTDVSVLIQGESGTGKEVVADMLHGLSTRRDKSILKISCAAIPETLLESELFGYERGAFTGAAGSKPGKFEMADGGTLFLDEIAEMSPGLQAKLLRVLQDGRFQRLGSTKEIQVDVRIISATHVDLPVAIAERKFREDLYYRLNVVHIDLPAMRDRREDVPVLADHFLKKYAARMQKKVTGIAPVAMQQLLAHSWPGNVRELQNTMQRALAVTSGEIIETFQLLRVGLGGVAGKPTGPTITVLVGATLAEAEDALIRETLKIVAGDKEKAAKILGVSSRTLYRRDTKPV
jgi:DNA-binding NtrC family response regulator